MLVDARNRMVKDEEDEMEPSAATPVSTGDPLASISQPTTSAPIIDMGPSGLDDLLGPSVPSSQPVTQQPAASSGGMSDLMDIFGPSSSQP